MKAVAFDPGRTTGYAQGIVDDGKLLVVTGQHKFSQSDLFTHLEWANPNVVIFERFEFRKKARKGLDMYPRELIGVIELYCQQKNVKVVKQMPAQVMGYFTDARLKEAFLYKMGKPHANDATRHILYWFKFGSGFQYNTRGYEAGF